MCMLCNRETLPSKESMRLGIALATVAIAYGFEIPLCDQCASLLADDAIAISNGVEKELDHRMATETAVNNYFPTGSNN